MYATVGVSYMDRKCLGFTLTEILIVLVIIGVLTAILMPVAFQSAPDENVLKFKKAVNTLTVAVRELANSDKYFANGDFGYRFDGVLLRDDGGVRNGCYFMESLTDLITVKTKHCSDTYNPLFGIHQWCQKDIETGKKKADELCIKTLQPMAHTTDFVYKFTTPDNVLFYGLNVSFGETFSGNRRQIDDCKDSNGFSNAYATVCIDVDGIPDSASEDDCVNECPFAVGVRYDGKILLGERADEWMNKSLKKE